MGIKCPYRETTAVYRMRKGLLTEGYECWGEECGMYPSCRNMRVYNPCKVCGRDECNC